MSGGGTSVTQIRNSELVDLLSTDFIRRNEATVAWGNACSMFQLLPGLRGFWPMSSVDEAGWAHDLSGQGRVLKYNGNPTYGIEGLHPYLWLDGTGDYLSRPDEAGLDIIGTESIVTTGYKGLTIGGWFQLLSIAPGTNMGLIGKYNDNAVNQRSYLLFFDDASNTLYFYLSTDGTAVVNAQSAAVVASQWYFVVGRYTPSTELALFVNGTKTTTVAAIPASIYSSTADFCLGAWANGASGRLNGLASLCFLTATALPDTIIQALYWHSKRLFGV